MLEIFSYLNKGLSSKNDNLFFFSKEFDFGKIKLGEERSTEFTFENIGQTAIIILGVESSCGCTVASYPRYPITPGSKNKIMVHFKGTSVGVSQKTLILKMYGAKHVTLVVKARVYE